MVNRQRQRAHTLAESIMTANEQRADPGAPGSPPQSQQGQPAAGDGGTGAPAPAAGDGSSSSSASLEAAVLQQQLRTAREEAAAYRTMQLELQSRHPDVQRVVEAALRREQAVQEVGGCTRF
jgi:hypothetical protein